MLRSVPATVLALAGVLLLLALWLFRTSPAAEAERARVATAAGGPTTAPPVTRVDAAVIRSGDARTRVEVAGVLEPVRSVQVGAEVSGRVVEIAVEEHSRVGEGEVLVRLDPALPAASVERHRASLLKAEAAAGLAASELRRQRELTDRGVSSKAELDRAESEMRATRAEVAAARAALLDSQTRLDKTRIEAPFAGVVAGLDLEPGAYLQPGDPVAELLDLSAVEIEVGVGDAQVLALGDGDPVEVRVDVLPGEWFAGRILRVGRSPDRLTRKYPVPVRVPNPEERLLPGMLGTVRFEIGDARPSLRVPRRAVLREFDLDWVYLLEGDAEEGVARTRRQRVATRALPFQPDLLEVTGGLEPGSRIAISGIRELRDGLRVRFEDRSFLGGEPRS